MKKSVKQAAGEDIKDGYAEWRVHKLKRKTLKNKGFSD